MRPGERPSWWDAKVDWTHFETWRAAAAAAHLSVDVWVALLLEFDLVLSDLRDLPDPLGMLERASDEKSLQHLGSWTQLRGWLVDEAVVSADTDELPELLIPERIAARVAPGLGIAGRLSARHFELARACDRCAALQGRTMESWALRAALRQV